MDIEKPHKSLLTRPEGPLQPGLGHVDGQVQTKGHDSASDAMTRNTAEEIGRRVEDKEYDSQHNDG